MQPFRINSSSQDYSNTAYYYNNNTNSSDVDLDLMLTSINYPLNWDEFKENSRFSKQFDLLSNESSGQYFSFTVFFFPYYIGEYKAELKIKYIGTDNFGTGLRNFSLNFIGRMVGNVSEVDHTEHPELTLELDHTSSGGFFEIY
jgi:hypothetical protein